MGLPAAQAAAAALLAAAVWVLTDWLRALRAWRRRNQLYRPYGAPVSAGLPRTLHAVSSSGSEGGEGCALLRACSPVTRRSDPCPFKEKPEFIGICCGILQPGSSYSVGQS